MKEFLGRLKNAHKKEEKKEEVPPPETISQQAGPRATITRRAFFERYVAPAAAAGALAAVPTLMHAERAEAAALQGSEAWREREARIDRAVHTARNALNSPDVRAARMGQGENSFMRVLRAMQFPVSPQLIRGTKYDMETVQKKHCVQMTYEWQGENKPYFVQWLSRKAGGFKTDKQAGYGNGIFFGAQNRFLTARHIASDALQRQVPGGKRDLNIMNLGTLKCHPEQVIRDSTLTNAQIDGAFVSIEGIDPDATADSEGYKSYPGVAVRLTREFVDRVFTQSPPDMKELLSRSFMVAIPPGEGTGPSGNKPGTGMSGSPVFTLHNGERALAGVMYALASYADPEMNTSYDFAFFHGIDEVREQVQEQKRSGV